MTEKDLERIDKTDLMTRVESRLELNLCVDKHDIAKLCEIAREHFEKED